MGTVGYVELRVLVVYRCCVLQGPTVEKPLAHGVCGWGVNPAERGGTLGFISEIVKGLYSNL